MVSPRVAVLPLERPAPLPPVPRAGPLTVSVMNTPSSSSPARPSRVSNMLCDRGTGPRRPATPLLLCHRERRVRSRLVVQLVAAPGVGLAAAPLPQRRDLGFEVGQALEIAIHAGEPEVGDLVEIAQRGQDRQPDLVA